MGPQPRSGSGGACCDLLSAPTSGGWRGVRNRAAWPRRHQVLLPQAHHPMLPPQSRAPALSNLTSHWCTTLHTCASHCDPTDRSTGAESRLHSHPPDTHGWALATELSLAVTTRALLTIVPQGPSAPAQSSFSCWLPSPSPGKLLHARTVGPRPNTTRLGWLPQGHAPLLRVSLWVGERGSII